jgi:hypothetical protein
MAPAGKFLNFIQAAIMLIGVYRGSYNFCYTHECLHIMAHSTYLSKH